MPTSAVGVAGKVIAITGASSGIGEAAAQGAQVVLGARRTAQLATITAEIETAGGTARALDVTDAA